MKRGVMNCDLLCCLFPREARLMTLLAIMAREGIEFEVFFRAIRHPDKKLLYNQVCAFAAMGWLTMAYETVTCHVQPSDIVQAPACLGERGVGQILNALTRHLERGEDYQVPARLFLGYLLEERQLVTTHPLLAPLFAKAVAAFVPHYEISLRHKGRERVLRLEDRLDYRLLEFVEELGSTPSLAACLRMKGELLCQNFRYESCEECFSRAETLLGGQDTPLLTARAWQLYNLGYIGHAVLMAHRAFHQGILEGRSHTYVDACIMLCYLCAVADDMVASRMYLKTVDGYCKTPQQRVRVKMVLGLYHKDESRVAMKYLDEAELEAHRLYGSNSPVMSTLSHIRSVVTFEAGKHEDSMRHYQSYVEYNNYNYGPSDGSLACLYGGVITAKVAAMAAASEIESLTHTMNSLCEMDRLIAPGVRMSVAMVNGIVLYCLGLYEKARAQFLKTKTLCETLMPDEDTARELKCIFHNGVLPAAVFMHDALQVVENYLSDIDEKFDE